MGRAKYGRGLAREIVSAVNSGVMQHPFTVEDVQRLVATNKWDVPETMLYPVLHGGSSDSHSPTHKKYFVNLGNGQFMLRDDFVSPRWR